MKIRNLFVLVLVFIILLIPASVLAHSGRTDGNGGHTDKSTGVYHYHHGYSAHQHPGGVCPYEDDSEDLFEDDDEFIIFDDWDDSDYAEDEAAYWEEEAHELYSKNCELESEILALNDKISEYAFDIDELNGEIYKLENQLLSEQARADNYKNLYEDQQATTPIVVGVAVVVIIGVIGWFKRKDQ